MISDKDAKTIKDCVDNMRIDRENRDLVIREALKAKATVPELVKLTGLTRARIYQIKKGTR